jgi:hypothetical protein
MRPGGFLDAGRRHGVHVRGTNHEITPSRKVHIAPGDLFFRGTDVEIEYKPEEGSEQLWVSAYDGEASLQYNDHTGEPHTVPIPVGKFLFVMGRGLWEKPYLNDQAGDRLKPELGVTDFWDNEMEGLKAPAAGGNDTDDSRPDYNSALCKKSFPRPATQGLRYKRRSSTSCACWRNPINSAPDTASGRLTQSGATRIRMSCGKGKRSIISGFWTRQRSDMRSADSP